jgi:hypothetical protein
MACSDQPSTLFDKMPVILLWRVMRSGLVTRGFLPIFNRPLC